jgi:hypothetical protein
MNSSLVTRHAARRYAGIACYSFGLARIILKLRNNTERYPQIQTTVQALRGATATKQSMFPQAALWIASRSLSSGGADAPTHWLAMTKLRCVVRQINPTGKSAKTCPDLRAKIFRFRRRANH